MADHVDKLDFAEVLNAIRETIRSKSINECYREIDSLLQHLLQLISKNDKSVELGTYFVQTLETILDAWLSSTGNDFLMSCVVNCYRVCRNACALYPETQTVIHSSDKFVLLTQSVLLRLLTNTSKTEEVFVLLRCCVQFLGNYSSGNQENQRQVWNYFQTLFNDLLREEDKKLQEYTLLVIHLCLRGLGSCDQSPDTWSLLATALSCAVEHESEHSDNGLLVMEDALCCPGFCEAIYPTLPGPACVLLLEVCISCLNRLPEGRVESVSPGLTIPAEQNLHFLAATFIQESQHILHMDTVPDVQNKAMCRVKELECLCLATSHPQLYGSLQEVRQLVTTAVELLKSVQTLGRERKSVFSNVQKMSQSADIDFDHPVYGLKRDLIRLLGNLAYKHQHNQNLIRELDGISAIMEQTNIDGKNPFITQWSVFALHNLTEENADNREYVANMRLEGVANNQAVLDEMGLSADVEDGKVVVKKKRV